MDVSHELGALRFVVDSPLSSKVAMFNQQVNQHKQSQLLNPFAQTDGRASPKPSFSKDEYGKPLAGSLTEMRGQKANMHVLREMLELCQIIDSEGYDVKDEPAMRVIPFGELFNIYNYISDKVVGILLRARKHKLVEFEGEMLFQRRDDDVPVFLVKPIHEIRREMNEKIECIKRCGSPVPQATSVLLDKQAHGLGLPKGATPRSSVSRTPSPASETKAKTKTKKSAVKTEGSTEAVKTEVQTQNNTVTEEKPAIAAKETVAEPAPQSIETKAEVKVEIKEEVKKEVKEEVKEEVKANTEVVPPQPQPTVEEVQPATPAAEAEAPKTDANNNNKNTNDDIPTIIIEATAVYEGGNKTEETTETNSSSSAPDTIIPASTEPNNVESNAPVEPPASA